MGIENRKERRRHIIYYLQILDPTSGQVLGRLVDITTTGMMLITENPLHDGVQYSLRIALPPEFEKARYIDVTGQSVWCHKDVNPDYYAVGFRLNEPSVEQVGLILDLIEQLGFAD